MRELTVQGKKVQVEPVVIEGQSGSGTIEVTLKGGRIVIARLVVMGAYRQIDNNQILINHQTIIEDKE